MIHSKGHRIWDFIGGKFNFEFKSTGLQAGLHSTDAHASHVSLPHCAHLHSFIAVFVLPQASAVWR